MFLVVTVVAVFNAICVPVLDEHRWIEIHHQQMATIEQLENHPPPGISLAGWQMQLQFWGGPGNVWVGSLRMSEYTVAEMVAIQSQLEDIVRELPSVGSFETGDRIYALLLEKTCDVRTVAHRRSWYLKIDGDLQRWVSEGSYDNVKTTIANGSPINASVKRGLTALHVAAEGGHLQIVERMLANGANPNAQIDTGETPADLAKLAGHESLALRIRQKARPKDSE